MPLILERVFWVLYELRLKSPRCSMHFDPNRINNTTNIATTAVMIPLYLCVAWFRGKKFDDHQQ